MLLQIARQCLGQVMFSRIAALANHIQMSHRNRHFKPYECRVLAAGEEINFYVATTTGEGWYVGGMPKTEAGQVINASKEIELTIKQFVSPGDQVVEVGGHHGFMTTLLAKRVRSEKRGASYCL